MIERNYRENDSGIYLTIAITCYNEEKYIVNAIDTIFKALRRMNFTYEVIVIDDASRDNSVQKIQQYMAEHPNNPLILQANKRNYGWAHNYIEGAFLGHGKYYKICVGDNAQPEDALVEIFRQIGKADVIITYPDQRGIVGKTPFRKFLSRLFTFLVNTISGYNIKYYNGLPVHVRYDILRWHPLNYGFGFQADIITCLLDQGASYLQMPTALIDRKGASSGALTLKNALSVIHTLLEIAMRRLKRILYRGKTPKPIEVKLEQPPS